MSSLKLRQDFFKRETRHLPTRWSNKTWSKHKTTKGHLIAHLCLNGQLKGIEKETLLSITFAFLWVQIMTILRLNVQWEFLKDYDIVKANP